MSGKVLSFCALGALLAGAPARADLLKYIQKADPTFSWKLNGKTTVGDGEVYDLHLVSQTWQDIKWEHQLQVYQPRGVKPNGTMLLWNQGGKASFATVAFGMDLARKINAPVAFLYGIPNQPLLGNRKEDALIAETFVRYLKTGDESWPLLFPMVKSLVRAMDALQAFTREQWKAPVKSFVVSGASKRGWTTWLTAVADSRVKAIAPLVIDTLNMVEQMDHQLRSFGKYSEQIRDYTTRGLVPLPDTDAAKKLWKMVDPYFYRDRITVPKLLINGNNDPYWTVDALNLYWDGLKGEKWVCYVPNAGHGLTQLKDGKQDRSRAVNALAAFARHQVDGSPLPRLSWKHTDEAGKLKVVVESSDRPLGGRIWMADAATHDFRKATWQEKPVELNGKSAVGAVEPPKSGCRAFYAELDFKIGDLTYHLSTQIRVAGKPAEKR